MIGLIFGCVAGWKLIESIRIGVLTLGGKSRHEAILWSAEPIRFLLWSIGGGFLTLIALLASVLCILAVCTARISTERDNRNSNKQIGF